MSDFLTADISDLMNGEDVPEVDADDEAYQALLKYDHELINTFTEKRKPMNYPEPVRKRHKR